MELINNMEINLYTIREELRIIRVIIKAHLIKAAINNSITYLVEFLGIKEKTLYKYINYPFLMPQAFVKKVIDKLHININLELKDYKKYKGI